MSRVVEIRVVSPQIYCVDLDTGMYWPKEYPDSKDRAFSKMIEMAQKKWDEEHGTERS